MSLPSSVDVAIIGAGAAGLGAAHALKDSGRSFVVLEARDRIGGRNWSIRRGTRIEMTDGTRQVCAFDEGLYWNAGPARIPSHHQALLGYCRALGVALEVEVNTNRGARLYNPAANSGQPIEMATGPPFSALPFSPALVTATSVGSGTKLTDREAA